MPSWPAVWLCIDYFLTQLKDQGPSRTCNESKEEEEAYACAPTLRNGCLPHNSALHVVPAQELVGVALKLELHVHWLARPRTDTPRTFRPWCVLMKPQLSTWAYSSPFDTGFSALHVFYGEPECTWVLWRCAPRTSRQVLCLRMIKNLVIYDSGSAPE